MTHQHIESTMKSYFIYWIAELEKVILQQGAEIPIYTQGQIEVYMHMETDLSDDCAKKSYINLYDPI